MDVSLNLTGLHPPVKQDLNSDYTRKTGYFADPSYLRFPVLEEAAARVEVHEAVVYVSWLAHVWVVPSVEFDKAVDEAPSQVIVESNVLERQIQYDPVTPPRVVTVTSIVVSFVRTGQQRVIWSLSLSTLSPAILMAELSEASVIQIFVNLCAHSEPEFVHCQLKDYYMAAN